MGFVAVRLAPEGDGARPFWVNRPQGVVKAPLCLVSGKSGLLLSAAGPRRQQQLAA
jgi:hypothetical protein